MKFYFSTIKALVFIFLFNSFIAGAQNTNQNQINNTVPHNNNSTNPTQNTSPNVNQNNNSGNVNEQNNNINNPYTTVPYDSVNGHSHGSVINPPAPKHDALQEERHILNQSGQNQVIIPPNAAGPDTSIRQIPSTGGKNNSFPDTKGKIIDQKPVNPTLMGSPTDTVK